MLPNHPNVRGINLDPQTRCEHYHGPTDIIAIKMKCCGVYYACKDCHPPLPITPSKFGRGPSGTSWQYFAELAARS